MKNNYIKIKFLTSIFTIATTSLSYAQVRIVDTTTLQEAVGSSAFIDASSISALNSTSNIGKGLLFPRTDLSMFTSFGGSPIGVGNSYPNRYDGMIVYNTKDGGRAGVGNTEGDLKPGFWFYENKSTSTNGGTWKQISSPTTNILSLSGNTLTSTVNGVLAQVTLPAASSGIDNPANNGLSKDGTTIQLGGVLNKKTNIDNYGHDFNINGTGKVGIGTWDPTQKLDVRGTVRIVDGTQGAGKVLTSDANGIASWESLPNVNTVNTLAILGNTLTSNVNGISASVNIPVGNGVDNPANNGLSKDGTTIQLGGVLNKKTNIDNYGHDFNINGAGNVGIGTWDPTQKLDVDGAIRIRGAQQLAFGNDDRILAIEPNGYVKKVNIPFGVDNPVNNGLSKDGTTIQLGGNLNKDTRIDNFGNSFRIVGAGNTGIGTDNPTNKLHVNGKLRLEDGTQGVGKVLTSDATGVASWSNLPENGVDNPANNGLSKNGTTIQLGGNLNKDTRIDNYGNKFSIVGAGNVGVGTDDPTQRLHIANGKLRLQDGTQGAGKVLTSDANGVATWRTVGEALDNANTPRFINAGDFTTASVTVSEGGTQLIPNGVTITVPAGAKYKVLLNLTIGNQHIAKINNPTLAAYTFGNGRFQLRVNGNTVLTSGAGFSTTHTVFNNTNVWQSTNDSTPLNEVIDIDNSAGSAPVTRSIQMFYNAMNTTTGLANKQHQARMGGTYTVYRMN